MLSIPETPKYLIYSVTVRQKFNFKCIPSDVLYCIVLQMVVHILIAPITVTITNLIGAKTHWHAASVRNCAPGQKLCSFETPHSLLHKDAMIHYWVVCEQIRRNFLCFLLLQN